MPWQHCDLELSDTTETCETCGTTKQQWTVEFGRTREFRVARKLSVRIQLVDPDGDPIEGEPYEAVLPDESTLSGELSEQGSAKIVTPGDGLVRVSFPNRAPGSVELLARREARAEDLESTDGESEETRDPSDPAESPESESSEGEGEEATCAQFTCRPLRARWRFCAANFRVALLVGHEEGYPQTPFRLDVGGERIEGESWEDGVVRANVPEDASEATLTLTPEEGDELTLQLSFDLGDASEAEGAQARLNNLGYSCGNTDGELGALSTAALRQFQRYHGLPRAGELDEATIAKLQESYGC